MNFWNGLPMRQKVLAVALMLTLIVAGIQLYPPSEQSVNVTNAAGNLNGNFQPSAPVLPTPGLAPPGLAVLRDPFAVPQGYALAKEQPLPSQSSSPPSFAAPYAAPAPNFGTTGTFTGANPSASAGASASASPSPAISLTGVVGSGDSKAIIIRYGSDSRSYRIHDQVGPYEIVAISDRSVTLAGSAGHKVLCLGE